MVIGVPDSGIDAAIGYATRSGIPYGKGLVINRYVGRTFIRATQSERVSAVQLKINVLKETIQGKRIIMIDDSIVREPLLQTWLPCLGMQVQKRFT